MPRAYVYMLASQKNGTLYIGVTSNLVQRLWEHENHIHPDSFTAKYGVTNLVWYEEHDNIAEAIHHEKRLKKYKREWKIALIEEANPDWRPIDLVHGLFMDHPIKSGDDE